MSLTLEVPQEFYDALQEQVKELYIQTIQEAKRDAGVTREYLTPKEACELIGVSNNTFTNNFIDQGLPVYRISNKRWVKKEELHEFIASHRVITE